MDSTLTCIHAHTVVEERREEERATREREREREGGRERDLARETGGAGVQTHTHTHTSRAGGRVQLGLRPLRSHVACHLIMT